MQHGNLALTWVWACVHAGSDCSGCHCAGASSPRAALWSLWQLWLEWRSCGRAGEPPQGGCLQTPSPTLHQPADCTLHPTLCSHHVPLAVAATLFVVHPIVGSNCMRDSSISCNAGYAQLSRLHCLRPITASPVATRNLIESKLALL